MLGKGGARATLTYYFAGVLLRIAEGHCAVEMDFVVIPDELEDRDVKAAGEGDPVLLDANGVVFNVLTPVQKSNASASYSHTSYGTIEMVNTPLPVKWPLRCVGLARVTTSSYLHSLF